MNTFCEVRFCGNLRRCTGSSSCCFIHLLLKWAERRILKDKFVLIDCVPNNEQLMIAHDYR
jgi:hypothetical protein